MGNTVEKASDLTINALQASRLFTNLHQPSTQKQYNATDPLTRLSAQEEALKCVCPRSNPRMRLINMVTGESKPMSCKCYSCPHCGPFRALRLRKALQKVLAEWKMIRMWTFTIRPLPEETDQDNYTRLSECFSRLVTEIRRFSGGKAKICRFSYVRFRERHKSGRYHLHVFIDTYIDWHLMRALWDQITNDKSVIHVKFGFNAYTAARYVSKYVLKASLERHVQGKLYTRSQNMRLFPQVHKCTEWITNKRLFLYLNTLGTTPQALQEVIFEIETIYVPEEEKTFDWSGLYWITE